MRRQLATSRRRWGLGTFVVAILALAVGASQGLAGASGEGSATAPIEYHSGSCGDDVGKRVIGTAQFTLKGSTLTVRVKVHGADPGKYELDIHTGECGLVGTLGGFKVDASGDGEKSGSIDVSGWGRSFFANAENQNPPSGVEDDNDSLIVKL